MEVFSPTQQFAISLTQENCEEQTDAYTNDIYICYDWCHKEQVLALANNLTDEGFTCILDQGQFGGGAGRRERINGLIATSKLILCCLSEKYCNCRFVVDWACFQ